MAFQFSLQSLLDFRRSVEHQQELRLQATNQQVAAARRIINQLDDRIRQSKASFSEDLALGTTSAELRFALAVHTSLYRYRQDLERELLRRESVRDQQQRIFQQARRKRETFENLRDKQLNEYHREVTRREQRELDDLFLLRRSYLRRG